MSSYFGEMPWKKAVITPITAFPSGQQEKKHSRERWNVETKIAGSKKGGRQMGQTGAKCSSYVEIMVLVLNFEFPPLPA